MRGTAGCRMPYEATAQRFEKLRARTIKQQAHLQLSVCYYGGGLTRHVL